MKNIRIEVWCVKGFGLFNGVVAKMDLPACLDNFLDYLVLCYNEHAGSVVAVEYTESAAAWDMLP